MRHELDSTVNRRDIDYVCALCSDLRGASDLPSQRFILLKSTDRIQLYSYCLYYNIEYFPAMHCLQLNSLPMGKYKMVGVPRAGRKIWYVLATELFPDYSHELTSTHRWVKFCGAGNLGKSCIHAKPDFQWNSTTTLVKDVKVRASFIWRFHSEPGHPCNT